MRVEGVEVIKFKIDSINEMSRLNGKQAGGR